MTVDPTVMQSLLSLVLPRVPTTRVIGTWTPEQISAATDWAGATHLAASDNDDVVVPPMPEFLSKYDVPVESDSIWPVRVEVDE